MKGPYERLKYDLRRVWECPKCRHRERTPGSATSCFCRCQAKEDPLKRIPMKLVEDGARRKKSATAGITTTPTPPASEAPPPQ